MSDASHPLPAERRPARELGRRLAVSPTARVWLLNTLLAVVVGVIARALAGLTPVDRGPHVTWWLLAALFAVTELGVVHIHFRRGSHSLALGEVPLVVGLMFASPGHVMLAWALGGGIAMALVTNLPPVRISFNVAQFAIAGGVAALIFSALAPADATRPEQWGAALVAATAASTTAVTLIAIAMRLSGERLSRAQVGGMLRIGWLVAGTNTSLGLGVATIVGTDPWASVSLLPLLGALFVAYRAYTAEHAKHQSLEFLYEASRALTRATSMELGLAGVLAMALESVRAERAEACLFPMGDAETGSLVTVGADRRVEAGRAVAPAVLADLQSLVGRDHGARIVTPDDVPAALAEHLRREGVERAILAPLPGEEGTLGALVIANRLGVGAFGREDERLLEMLARQTGASLGQDRLGRQVRELDELSRSLEHKAFHDPLTGLANRLLFMDRVKHALSRREGNAAVLYIDLDDFKTVNDTLGHDAGDELLTAVAARVRNSLRAEDTPARLGGDEFAILLLDILEEHVRIVADRVLKALAAPVEIAGATRPIHASLGIAIARSGSTTAEELVRNADVAMYVSKHGGKRGYSLYDSSMEQAA
jgi:diguanylate cyclase (GGDEF)-like protein